MRRRTFFATISTGALAALGACSNGPGGVPTPSIAPLQSPTRTPLPSPPNDTATPTSFADQPLWPNANIAGSITAVRNHYLCGSVHVKDLKDIIRGGHCPVVVDLRGPTTWAVLPDGQGSWTTRVVTLEDTSQTTPDEPGTAVIKGPALIDDTHAYLVVSVPSPSGDSDKKSFTCPVDLVKIALADGTITASTRVSDSYVVDMPTESDLSRLVSLSFTADRSALLLAADGTSLDIGTGGLGLRLNAADLSVQFDANTLLAETHHHVRCGEALTVMKQVPDADEDEDVIIYLGTGATETMTNWSAALVRGDWLYYNDIIRQRPKKRVIFIEKHAAHARNLSTGETVTFHEDSHDFFDDGIDAPINTDQRELILLNSRSRPTFSVHQPGSATPMLSWESSEQAIPGAACVFGEVVYTAPERSKEQDENGKLRIISLTTKQDIGEVQNVAWGGSVAVTAWGLAATGIFYPAIEWLEAPAESATPSGVPSVPAPTPGAPSTTP